MEKSEIDRLVKLSGANNYEIGLKHGSMLAQDIKQNIAFYLKTFNQPQEIIEEISNNFKSKIEDFSPELAKEIKGIAIGADVPEWQIFMLNSRTEIFSIFKKRGQNQGITECTLLFFKESATMAENWDWALDITNQTYVFEISLNGKKPILTLSEAGIVGKIGINYYGFGIGMNYLEPSEQPYGIPIHVLIRHALEQESFEQAKNTFRKYGLGVSGNICLANHDGHYVGFELDGSGVYELSEQAYYCHTNHFLSKKEDTNNNILELGQATTSTAVRFLKTKSLIDQTNSALNESQATTILNNQEHLQFPILVPPTKSESLGEIGTIAQIILSLKEKRMSVRFVIDGFKKNYNYFL